MFWSIPLSHHTTCKGSKKPSFWHHILSHIFSCFLNFFIGLLCCLLDCSISILWETNFRRKNQLWFLYTDTNMLPTHKTSVFRLVTNWTHLSGGKPSSGKWGWVLWRWSIFLFSDFSLLLLDSVSYYRIKNHPAYYNQKCILLSMCGSSTVFSS